MHVVRAVEGGRVLCRCADTATPGYDRERRGWAATRELWSWCEHRAGVRGGVSSDQRAARFTWNTGSRTRKTGTVTERPRWRVVSVLERTPRSHFAASCRPPIAYAARVAGSCRPAPSRARGRARGGPGRPCQHAVNRRRRSWPCRGGLATPREHERSRGGGTRSRVDASLSRIGAQFLTGSPRHGGSFVTRRAPEPGSACGEGLWAVVIDGGDQKSHRSPSGTPGATLGWAGSAGAGATRAAFHVERGRVDVDERSRGPTRAWVVVPTAEGATSRPGHVSAECPPVPPPVR